MMVVPTTTYSNEIYLSQIGDDLDLDIVQDGENNQVKPISITSKLDGDDLTLSIDQNGDNHLLEGSVDGNRNTGDIYQGNGGNDNFARVDVTGDDNTLKVYQGKHVDGSLDTDETGDHEAYWTVTGNNNDLGSYQTDVNRSGGGGSPHHLANIIDGDRNKVEHIQMGKAGHDGFIEITGDDNTVDLYQRGNGGVKWADIVLTGDDHTVDVNQRGSNSASAAIDLTNSGGAYTLDLDQNVTTASDSYSITGYCATPSGCSVIVNRNN